MAIEQKIIELINADVDGEISSADKRELDAILASNAESRVFHMELASLCTAMDSFESLEPPPHLRHLIMDSVRPQRSTAADTRRFSRLLSAPALRFAAAFAAGVILTLSFVSSDNISRHAFEDVTGLVGTMSESGSKLPVGSSISISRADIAGNITSHRSGQILIIDFDLVTHGPVDIVAGFAGQSIWFNGFAQLESVGTSVAAEAGQVTLRMDGKRRYALYLHDAGSGDARIDLKFVSAGTVIHEAQLTFGKMER